MESYSKDFLDFLSKYKRNQLNSVELVTVDEKVEHKIKLNYSYSTFKTFICELVYNAINNMNKTIREYTIICENDKGVVLIKIGMFDDLDNEGELSVLKIITSKKTYILNKEDVQTLYIANRSNYCNEFTILEVMVLLYNGGYEPFVTTRFISCKTFKKEF